MTFSPAVAHAVLRVGCVLLAWGFLAKAAAQQVNAGPFVPSPEKVVTDMLDFAKVGPNDFVIDLGSGDGRIVRTAALKYGARGFGVDIDEKLVRGANEAAQREGIADRVKFLKQDLFKTDISQATVLTMYLLPNTVNMLKDKLLKELKPGTRVISHDYRLEDWEPDGYQEQKLKEKVAISGVETTLIYRYVIPARVAGSWNARLPGAATIELRQARLTRVSGSARIGGKEFPLIDPKLRGDQLSFEIADHKGVYRGTVKGGTIEGAVESAGARTTWSASLAK
jgi:hypothetical protein